MVLGDALVLNPCPKRWAAIPAVRDPWGLPEECEQETRGKLWTLGIRPGDSQEDLGGSLRISKVFGELRRINFQSAHIYVRA
eukprot:1340351-Amorphochlora_amoeboformis.AAC.2